MGDRTYMQFTVKTTDLERVFEISPHAEAYSERIDDDNGTTTLEFSEADGGGVDIIQPLIRDKENRGVNFVGYHNSGGTYPDMAFANYDGEYAEAVTTADVDIAVMVDWKNGEIVPQEESLRLVRRYFQIREKALAYLNITG